MKRNNKFTQMLAEYRPDLGDGHEYMQRLNSRMKTVEAAKHYYETERRRDRSRMVVAFVAGSITGAAMAIYLLLHPIIISSPNHTPHLLGWLTSNAASLLNSGTIILTSVLAAITATLLHSIVRKDYSL
ncbi:MAG: hypothetical protein IKG81_05835 [Bacteroidales bacterium]|nr:hypothetical protein [Bacteroidales bacterium]